MATGPRKKFDDIFSHLDTIHQRNGQTDTGRQTTAICIASRGKNLNTASRTNLYMCDTAAVAIA